MTTMEKPALKPLIAFFGATGGCAAAALALALNNGYTCTALARTPSKLTNLLLSKRVSQETMSSNLTIIQGDVLDSTAVLSTLRPSSRAPAGLIISGIGMVNLFKENTICTDAINSILSALASLQLARDRRPMMLAISTTGISSGPRDVPLLMGPLYHGLLAKPHKDKREMERVLGQQMGAASGEEKGNEKAVLKGVVIVRASLLSNGPALGEAKVRVGSEREPAVGYTISREDVGLWIYENFVKSGGEGLGGEKISLTY